MAFLKAKRAVGLAAQRVRPCGMQLAKLIGGAVFPSWRICTVVRHLIVELRGIWVEIGLSSSSDVRGGWCGLAPHFIRGIPIIVRIYVSNRCSSSAFSATLVLIWGLGRVTASSKGIALGIHGALSHIIIEFIGSASWIQLRRYLILAIVKTHFHLGEDASILLFSSREVLSFSRVM